MKTDELTLFLDTNSLLHYPPLKEVDWRAVCGCASVRLILCLQVIHELDEKKDAPRLGDRASRTIKNSKTIRKAGGAVRDGVTLEVFNYEVRATDFPATLSYDSKDDRIVHSVKKYQEEHSDARVAVYTEDMGMNLRCEANGVEVVEPDTKKRLENPQDELTKKYRQAMSELNESKNRIPVLEVIACEAGLSAPEKRSLEFEVIGAVAVRDLDAELAAYQKAKKLSPIAKQEIRGVGTIPVLPQQHDAIERYNRELADHLKEYKDWLEHSYFLDQVEAHRVEFALWLNNTGAAPADDIDLTVEVGDSVVFLYDPEGEDDPTFTRADPPKPPERPTQFFTDFGRLLPTAVMPHFDPPDLSHLWPKSVKVVKGEDGRPHRIEFSAKRLKHHESEHVGNFIAVVHPQAVRPFQMKYRITAATLPKPVEGVIPVIVRKQTGE